MSDADIGNAALQICKIGESAGLILQDELLARLNLRKATNYIRLYSRTAAFA